MHSVSRMGHLTMGRAYIGIDPGKKGAIAIIDNVDGKSEILTIAIPLIGKDYDVKRLSEMLRQLSSKNCYCVMEDVHAVYGSSASSTFEFGYGVGLIEGILVANNIPYSKIAPKKWQKTMWEGVSLQQKPSSTGKTMKTDTKCMSLIAVQRIFPNVDLRENERCKKPHDGIVDALLICEYGRRLRL